MPNHLATETSPYLQQHANNPVDWYPWSPEALDKAKRENKPILLSIGYAACHWCHVMAHESFEDAETAKVMNELFVNIKVDREERPDLDKIYQTAHYFLTQSNGGWPLTIFLSPEDMTPFFSGTYFPREARYQLPAFKDVLRTLATLYQKQHHEIKEQNQYLIQILNDEIAAGTKVNFTNAPVKLAYDVLSEKFDRENGGFGGAPKFPNPTRIEFLLSEKSPLASMTLTHMAEGGIYDQIQGGFFRYTVDAKWQIPHFEKMLYDNAQLLYLYAVASQETHDTYFADIAHETAQWIMTKMQSAEGGYYSSLDADSEGHEGKFYVWDKAELTALLTENEATFADLYFGFADPANFESQWHLHVAKPLNTVAEQLQISDEKAHALLNTIKQKLLTARANRIPPACDQKILTAWNALMIKGMATAAEVLDESLYLDSALRALDFIQQKLWVNNRLLVSYKDGKAHLPAYLDDYAFLLDALVALLQIHWNTQHLEFAIQLADSLLENFIDTKSGGFFFTANDHEKLLYRPKTMMDESIPAGNGIAAQALLTLGHLLGETRYIEAAEGILQMAWSAISQFPAEHCSLLMALNDFLKPHQIIVIRGSDSGQMNEWSTYCKDQNWLNNEVFAIPAAESNLPYVLTARKSTGQTCAYICQGMHCSAVITQFDELKQIMS